MDVKMDRRFIGRVLQDRRIERALMKRAGPIAQRLEAITPRRTGATAGSTRIETGHKSAKGDRRAVRIYQDFAAPHLNFRTRQRYMLQAL